MKEIKPTYVTFEQAKWLKEKGFDEPCTALFIHEIIQGNTEWDILELFERNNNDTYEFLLSCDMDWQKNYLRPEQWQVVEWLRINHGIWISVGNVYSEYTHWAYGIGKENKGMILPFREGQDNHDYFNSPQEAYSAAFDYIKDNNLI
jgi:hypothetical protein